MDSSTNVQPPPPPPPPPLAQQRSSPGTSRPQLTSLANAGLSASSSTPKSLKRSLPATFDPDARRRSHLHDSSPVSRRASTSPQRGSPNPNMAALAHLRNGASQHQPADRPNLPVTSRPPPPIITTSAPVAEPMSMDQPNITTTSPQSMTSADGLNARTSHLDLRPDDVADDRSNKALTFPGLPPPDQDHHTPARQLSLPNPGSAKSTPNKKHKCPHCATEFTRHHNLKSHLLTHSQEKPYPCEQCPARFRRLHDLKRHNKLHTGERPHICEKCGRKFARGDALARHNKGSGGCAGRRGSLGDDDYPEGASYTEGMDGIIYHDSHPDDGEASESDHQRRKSEPGNRSRRSTMQSQPDSGPNPYRQSSTYPGSMAVANSRNQFTQPLPSPLHLGPGSATPTYSSSHPQQPGSYAPSGPMTESPKPLSPGQPDSRRLSAPNDVASYAQARSPTLHMHPATYPRPGRLTPPPPPSLPLPNHQAPQLPPLDRLGGQPPEPRQPNVKPPSGPPMPFMPSMTGSVGSNTTKGSGSSAARSSAGSFRELLNSGPGAVASLPPDMALHERIRSLENEVANLKEDMRASERHYENRITRLNEENQHLRSQLGEAPAGRP